MCRFLQIFKDRLFSASSASSVKLQISLSQRYDHDGCPLKLLWECFCFTCIARCHVHHIVKAASVDGSCCCCLEIMLLSVLMLCWWIGPVSSQTEECHPLNQGVKPCFLYWTRIVHPTWKRLQNNVDNSNLSPVVKDKLFLAFELGDHPFGLFTVLWEKMY